LKRLFGFPRGSNNTPDDDIIGLTEVASNDYDPIAPRSPWQSAYVERLIGSIRRECLDHEIVLGEAQLHRILGGYERYYNYYKKMRTHRSLNKDAPV
jgi:Integrase core domain